MSKQSFLVAVLALALVAVNGSVASAQDAEAGKKIYGKLCAQCHGENGDGLGVAAPRVKPKPRDFTKGKYKIRTTPNGSIPLDADIARIIREGMPYSSMPAWPELDEPQIANVVAYLKTFSADFSDPSRNQVEAISIPEPTAFSAEASERGRKVFEELGCVRCHGDRGRGDGFSAPTLVDDWGHHLYPADLTQRWTFRGGAGRKDIYRAVSTGLNGTPMPAYAEVTTAEQRWDLVHYITSLGRGEQPGYADLVTVKRTPTAFALDAENADAIFAEAPVSYVALVGQVIEPGREFFPRTTEVAVRAVYDDENVTFELRWNDMRAETAGTNAPDLEVPTFENDPFGGAAAKTDAAASDAAADDDDPWGGETMDEEAAADEGGDVWGDSEVAEDEGGEGFWDDGGDEDEAAASGPDQEFSDAVAVQFPSQKQVGIRRPYFIFGDSDHPVDIWFADLAAADPTMWVGRGSDALESRGAGSLTGTKKYENGEWVVRLRRPLDVRGETAFVEGEFLPVAFSVWDGFNRERGNKRALSRWLFVFLEPGGEKSTVGPMVKAGLMVLGLELLVVVLVRRRFTGEDLDQLSADTNGEADV